MLGRACRQLVRSDIFFMHHSSSANNKGIKGVSSRGSSNGNVAL